MQHRFLLVVLLAMTTTMWAQDNGCDGTRYTDEVFSDFVVTTGIKFGENTTFGGNFKELFMDVYEPMDDQLAKRPAVVLAFGGGFTAGNRETMAFLCETFAKRGYVAATIDYRLIDGFPTDSLVVYQAALNAASDMAAAIRYLREDAATSNDFRINSDIVFAGGISAGAITAVHLAYPDEDDDLPALVENIVDENGGFMGNSSMNFEYSSSIQGVINYSGALKDASWIDSNDPPMISVHDDMDPVVPSDKGFSSVFPFGNYLEGSQVMDARLEELGIAHDLIIVPDSDGHVSFFAQNAATYAQEVITRTASFLHDIVCTMTTDVEILEEQQELRFSPNPSTGFLTLDVESKFGNYEVQVLNSAGQVVYTAQNVRELDLNTLPKGIYHAMLIFTDALHAPLYQKVVLH